MCIRSIVWDAKWIHLIVNNDIDLGTRIGLLQLQLPLPILTAITDSYYLDYTATTTDTDYSCIVISYPTYLYSVIACYHLIILLFISRYYCSTVFSFFCLTCSKGHFPPLPEDYIVGSEDDLPEGVAAQDF